MSTAATTTQTPRPGAQEDERVEPVAAVLAIAWPGAGHLYLGEVARGVLAMVGVLGLFLGGMLIGGIDVIDRREDPVWFVGQALVGPLAFGVDWAHQSWFKGVPLEELERARANRVGLDEFRQLAASVRRSARPGEVLEVGGYDDPRTPATESEPVRVLVPGPPGVPPPSSKSLGRMNELGTLFATIAGMLNLIVVIDAAIHGRRN